MSGGSKTVAAWQALLQQPRVRRILAACGSNAYAQATTIAMQLLSLPLFLSVWDVATYGQWIILSAVPAYLAMADAGMVTAAGNRMTMLHADGRSAEANRVFQSALGFLLAISALVLLLVLPLVLLAGSWWPADAGTLRQGSTAVALLVLTVMVTLLGGLPEAIYKATHRYALGTGLANTTRLLEWLGSLAGLWWQGDFVGVALGALLARTACTAAMAAHAARTTPEFRWSLADASLAEIRQSAGPAISFMAFPAANALNFQGMTLIVAALFGPAATVVFNTYRTLARVTVQATAVFSLAMWPEFSRLFGQREWHALTALYRRSRRLGLLLAAAASAVVFVLAPWVLQVWSQGQIAFEAPLMAAAMFYAAAAGAWHVARVLLLSTNRHAGLAWPYLAASAAWLPLAWALGQGLGLIGVVAAMALLEVGMVVFCSLLARRLLVSTRPGDAAPPLGVAA